MLKPWRVGLFGLVMAVCVLVVGGSAFAAVTGAPRASVAPSVTGFAPASGAVGSQVVVSGNGFTGASQVLFNGTASKFTVNSDSQITATVPATATTGQIQVNGLSSSATSFTVVPTIASFTRDGTTVTIDGSGYAGVNMVCFSAIYCKAFTLVSSTEIRVDNVSTDTPGPISLRYRNADGSTGIIATSVIPPVFPSKEGSCYGGVFTSDSTGVTLWFACAAGGLDLTTRAQFDGKAVAFTWRPPGAMGFNPLNGEQAWVTLPPGTAVTGKGLYFFTASGQSWGLSKIS
jgi:hypothetical protein